MMTELDFLKEHWSKQTDYPIKTRAEIQKILQKSSSNTLKWLIGANIFELCFFILIGLLFGNSAEDQIDAESIYWLSKLDYVIYALPIIFSLIFISLIRKINTNNSVSGLISSVIKARKLLNIYIYINFSIFIGIIYYSIYLSLTSEQFKNVNSAELSPTVTFTILIITCVLISIVYMLIIWGFYKLLYGRFLKRLNQNLDQLKDME
mgnify:CR=1 FL=1